MSEYPKVNYAWTNQELRILRESYPIMSVKEIQAKFLQRHSISSIWNMANRHGIRKNRSRAHWIATAANYRPQIFTAIRP